MLCYLLERWLPISIAPADIDLHVCVIDGHGVRALVFPCRRHNGKWLNAATKEYLDIEPSHWQEWQEKY
jgi:hypothetical protein